MANINQMIESKYLKQSDVVDDEALVTIAKVGRQNIAKENEEPEFKWLIRFNEFPKPMVLNSTNIKRLARACSSEETDEWVGKQVILYVDHDVEFAGNVVGGLRIKAAAKTTQGTRKAETGGNLGKFHDIDSDVPF